MARTRKKIEPIENLGNLDKLTVQKSKPLYALWRSDLTLAEFKILDTYLSRIDSHKPEKRTVRFEKGELENLLGVTKINKAELEPRLIHLMGQVVKISDADEKKGFRLVTLFEEAVAEQDEYGLWQINLECTQKAMKYFFNIENLGYLRYKLRCITSLTSRYTYITFVYLESNRYRKSWEIDLEKLKEILNCEKEETYKQYKFFNVKILKKVQKELSEKTECRYTYEPIKKGRSVVAIKFTLETLPKLEDTVSEDFIPGQMSLDDFDRSKRLWEDLLDEFSFSAEELGELNEIILNIPSYKLPEDNTTYTDDIEFRRYHYLALKLKAMERYDTKNKIKNKFAYLAKMLKEDMH